MSLIQLHIIILTVHTVLRSDRVKTALNQRRRQFTIDADRQQGGNEFMHRTKLNNQVMTSILPKEFVYNEDNAQIKDGIP